MIILFNKMIILIIIIIILTCLCSLYTIIYQLEDKPIIVNPSSQQPPSYYDQPAKLNPSINLAWQLAKKT